MLAVLALLRATTTPPEARTEVVVARSDLAAGQVMGLDDLGTAALPADAVPDGSTAGSSTQLLVGRSLAAPVRRGEPVTDVRLVAPGLLEGYPGLVGSPVRIADPGVVRLLRVGDRVDLVATAPDGSSAVLVVADAPVMALPQDRTGDDGVLGGGLVLVAVTSVEARELARGAVGSVMSVVLKR